jgi:hypothetical protein
VLDEAGLRAPAHRDRGGPRLHPPPVGAREQLVGDPAELGLGRIRPVEVLAAEQRAREQERRVDRRQLGVAEAVPGLHVEEVVVEALVAGDAFPGLTLRRVPEEPQGREDPIARRLAGNVAALDADRVRREPEADRGDARERRRRIAIRHQSGSRIGRLPEEVERAALEIVEQRGILRRERRRRSGHRHRPRRRRRPVGPPARARRGERERERERRDGEPRPRIHR